MNYFHLARNCKAEILLDNLNEETVYTFCSLLPDGTTNTIPYTTDLP
jgi:hypothetical protein